MNKERQVHLLSDGVIQQTCWVEDKSNLKVGVYITLKDSKEPDREWKVIWMSGSRTRTAADKIRSANVFESIMPKS